jgi:hypothetical protein
MCQDECTMRKLKEFAGLVCLPWDWKLLTELSLSWGATNRAITQELPSILWNPKVQYYLHKSPPLVPILNHINPISLRSIFILFTHLHLGLPSGLYTSGFPANILYAFLFSPICATCPSHLKVGPLSSRHGASSGCGWRKRPPVMEGSCKYIE